MIDNYQKIVEKFNDDIYNLSVELIKNVCNDLNKENKANELIKKYLKKNSNIKKKEIDIKRPKTAYIYFLEDIRPKIAKKYPNDKLGDISKRIGKLWHSLNSTDKEKYLKLAKKDASRFKKELNKKNVIKEVEQSQTLFDLEESNIIKDDLFSSEEDSLSNSNNSDNSDNSDNSNDSDNSDNSNNSNDSNNNSNSSVISSDTFSDIESDDETKFDESSKIYKKK